MSPIVFMVVAAICSNDASRNCDMPSSWSSVSPNRSPSADSSETETAGGGDVAAEAGWWRLGRDMVRGVQCAV